jgi:hypothetical protein
MVPLRGNSLENRFVEYLSNATLRWVSGMSANHCPFRAFFNFRKSQESQEAKVNKVDGPFL